MGDEVKTEEIRCLHCRQWFKNYGISFSNMKSFDTATLTGNEIQCPHCGKMTGCNKENSRIRSVGGGFTGIDT